VRAGNPAAIKMSDLEVLDLKEAGAEVFAV